MKYIITCVNYNKIIVIVNVNVNATPSLMTPNLSPIQRRVETKKIINGEHKSI